MSDNTPQRPEGQYDATAAQPRVQVEPTPTTPEQASGAAATGSPYAASGAHAAPAVETMSRTVVKTKTK